MIETKIKHIMNNFNFLRVHKTMTFLNWRWYNSPCIPTIEKIKEVALRLLRDVSKGNTNSSVASGGFKATKSSSTEATCDCNLELDFIIESWEE